VDLAGRQARIQRGDEPAHRINRGRIGVHGPHIEAAVQEVGQIASGAAARIEHAPAMVESAAEQLIEQIDVDLAELRS
jgi:hypothetical protein